MTIIYLLGTNINYLVVPTYTMLVLFVNDDAFSLGFYLSNFIYYIL